MVFNLDFNKGYGYANQVMGNQFSPNSLSTGLANPTQVPQATGFMEGLGDWWNSSRTGDGFLTSESMFGGEGSTGWVNPLMKGVGSVMSGWNAMQQLDLAKEQFAFSKQAYQTNLANQTQLTNQALVDRQNARAAANSSFQAPDEQWKKQNLLPANK